MTIRRFINNRLVLLIVSKRYNPEYKYAIVKTPDRRNKDDILLSTNSKDELKIWLNLRGLMIKEKGVVEDNSDDDRLHIAYEMFVLEQV